MSSSKKRGIDVVFADDGKEFVRISDVADMLEGPNKRRAKMWKNKVVKDKRIPVIQDDGTTFAHVDAMAQLVEDEYKGKGNSKEVLEELRDPPSVPVVPDNDDDDDLESCLGKMQVLSSTFAVIAPYDRQLAMEMLSDIRALYERIKLYGI